MFSGASQAQLKVKLEESFKNLPTNNILEVKCDLILSRVNPINAVPQPNNVQINVAYFGKRLKWWGTEKRFVSACQIKFKINFYRMMEAQSVQQRPAN